MKVAVVSLDSDIGAGLKTVHEARGDTVVGCSRRQEGMPRMDVSDQPTWYTPPDDVERVYYTIAGYKGREIDQMNVSALASIRYLQWMGQRLPEGIEIVVLSSYLGSIQLVEDPTKIVYRMSKAALNMGVRCLSGQQRRHQWLLLHPGRVRTKMLSVEEWPTGMTPVQSATVIVKSLRSWDGKFDFVDHEGRVLPW